MSFEIQSGDEPEIEPQPAKKRGRKKAAPKNDVMNPAAPLLRALDFILPAQKKTGPIMARHCMMYGNWLVASNGVLTIGTPINETFYAFPNTHALITALEQVTEQLTMTQADEFSLHVDAGNFAANVPCSQPFVMTQADAPNITVDERLINAIRCVLPFATDGAPDAITASVCIRPHTAVATNRHAVLEAWHGFDMPQQGVLIPRASADAIAKCPLPVVSFGYAGSSATFHFEGGSFIKTQLYDAEYPALLEVIAKIEPARMSPVNPELFKHLKVMAKFSDNGIVTLKPDEITINEGHTSASFVFAGLGEEMKLSIKYLLMAQHVIENAEISKDKRGIYFARGNTARGAIAAVAEPE